ncbi:hypothetical protein GCM10009839_14340 [Catenulispora yoronensis]|uniref:Uncharacterized protein n=2 Tax=Catenulispora yoronensis TaxID=450799 RepID=A0ABN2TSK2_9ACTN
MYVHSDGSPAAILPVLADIHHRAFFRDLHQMRTVLLKHTAGWSLLTADPAYAAKFAADRPGFLDVPGVGVARTEDDIDMTATGEDVYGYDYAYLFDLTDRSLSVHKDGMLIAVLTEAQWSPIGPPAPGRPELPVVAAEPIGELCLTGAVPTYTSAHISALMKHLDLADGDRLRIDDGGDLHGFFDAAQNTGLLPGQVWFVMDGEPESSEGGWIRLPDVMAMADVQTLFIEAADFNDDKMAEAEATDTATQVREVLEFMAARTASAAAALNKLTTPPPVHVLTVRRPGEAAHTYTFGGDPQVYTLDVPAGLDDNPHSAFAALTWTADQVATLHDWPLPLRLRAMLAIRRAVRCYPAARALANVLGAQHVDSAVVEHARFAAGHLPATVEDGQRQAALDAWLAVHIPAEPPITYSEACRRAATAQGLDPICEALREAGIGFGVDQTGGFCMLVNVPTGHDYYFGITATEDPDLDPAAHWLVVRYSSVEYDEGEVIGWSIPTAEVIALLHRDLSPAALAA